MRHVYLDSCFVIYLLEETIGFSARTRNYLAANPDTILCVSSLVRLEVLIRPLRNGCTELVRDYEDFLAYQQFLPITEAVFNLATTLRASSYLKTPDALHLATAQYHGCAEFWTNDDRLNKVAGNMAKNILMTDV